MTENLDVSAGGGEKRREVDVCFRPDSLGWACKGGEGGGGSSALSARMFMFKGPVLAMVCTSQAKTKTKIQIHIHISHA